MYGNAKVGWFFLRRGFLLSSSLRQGKRRLEDPTFTIMARPFYKMTSDDIARTFSSENMLTANGFPNDYLIFENGPPLISYAARVSGLCVPPPAAYAVCSALIAEQHKRDPAFSRLSLSPSTHVATGLRLCRASYCHRRGKYHHPRWELSLCEEHYAHALSDHRDDDRCQVCSGKVGGAFLQFQSEDQKKYADGYLPKASYTRSNVDLWATRNVNTVFECVKCKYNLCTACLTRNFRYAAFILNSDVEFTCPSCRSPFV